MDIRKEEHRFFHPYNPKEFKQILKNGVLIKELTSQPFSEGQHLLLIEDDKLPQGCILFKLTKEVQGPS